jgi:predicted transposase/invertase (TIGR01784 family)
LLKKYYQATAFGVTENSWLLRIMVTLSFAKKESEIFFHYTIGKPLLEHLGSLDEVRRFYEAREIEIHDEVSRIAGAKEEGKIEGKLEMATELLLMGMDIESVAQAAKLPVEQIMQLKKSLQN